MKKHATILCRNCASKTCSFAKSSHLANECCFVQRKRPSWDSYFIDMCNQVAKRSTCLRRQVGAILVRDKRVIATGYNGPPPGISHCLDTGCIRDELKVPSGERQEICKAQHAEANCILQCALHGVSAKGCTIYCNTQPCSTCAKDMSSVGIIKLVYPENALYPDPFADQFLTNIEIIKLRQ